jgi:hypothetical protein
MAKMAMPLQTEPVPIARCLSPIGDWRMPIGGRRLRPANCPFPITDWLEIRAFDVESQI